MVDTKEQRDAFILKLMNDNTTHVKDYETVCQLCEMVDELQARAEATEDLLAMERESTSRWRNELLEETKESRDWEVRFIAAEKERDTLAKRVKALEDGLRGLQSMSMHSVYTVLDEACRILERK